MELINKGVDWVPAAPANSTSVATPAKEEGATVETPVKPTEASKATEVATPEADKKGKNPGTYA